MILFDRNIAYLKGLWIHRAFQNCFRINIMRLRFVDHYSQV